MKKKALSLLLAVLMIGSLLAGCGSNDTASTTDATVAAPVEAVVEVPDEITKGGTLTIALSSSPMHLDPVKYTGTYEAQIIYQVCDTIVNYDQELAEITGESAAPDVLDDIFSRFCIGK